MELKRDLFTKLGLRGSDLHSNLCNSRKQNRQKILKTQKIKTLVFSKLKFMYACKRNKILPQKETPPIIKKAEKFLPDNRWVHFHPPCRVP